MREQHEGCGLKLSTPQCDRALCFVLSVRLVANQGASPGWLSSANSCVLCLGRVMIASQLGVVPAQCRRDDVGGIVESTPEERPPRTTLQHTATHCKLCKFENGMEPTGSVRLLLRGSDHQQSTASARSPVKRISCSGHPFYRPNLLCFRVLLLDSPKCVCTRGRFSAAGLLRTTRWQPGTRASVQQIIW